MEVVKFKAQHLMELDLQDGQAYLSDWVTVDQAKALEEYGWSYTSMIDGRPVGCAGVIPMWQGRGTAWSYISKDLSGSAFIQAHKAVARFLDMCYLQRIEMTVDCEFEQGHRWAKMLGFTMEAERMRAYRPDGGDCALYARIRE